MTKIILLILTGLLITPAIITAKTLTVKNAIEQAYESSPKLMEIKKDIEAAKKQMKYQAAPEKMQFYYFKEGIPNFASEVFAEERLAINQNIEFPGKTINKYKSYKERINAKNYYLDYYKIQLKSEVKQLYSKLALYKEKVKLREKQLSIADTMRQAANLRYQAGYVSELDVLKSDIFYNEIYNSLQDARINLHTSRYDLFTKIGLDPEEQTYDIKFPDEMTFKSIDISQNNALSKLDSYPLYKSYEKQVQANRKLKSAEYSNLFPDLGLSYYIQNYGNGMNFQGVQVTVDIPVWFTFNESKRIQEKQIFIEKADITKRKKQLDLKLEIELAWHGYNESMKKIKTFNNMIRDKSSRLRDLALISYNEGELDLITLLIYESTYIENELNYLEELQKYYHNVFILEKFLQKEFLYN